MKSVVVFVSLLFVAAPEVFAQDCGGSCNGSNASAMMSEGVGLVLAGSLSAVAASGQLVVEGIEKTAEGMVVVIKGSGKAASATVKLSGKAVKGLSIAVGEAVELTALSTGYTLYYSGKAIAFIPTEVGKALIEHAKAK